jgi:hypothetical protein
MRNVVHRVREMAPADDIGLNNDRYIQKTRPLLLGKIVRILAG